jgi:hypothetical protein
MSSVVLSVVDEWHIVGSQRRQDHGMLKGPPCIGSTFGLMRCSSWSASHTSDLAKVVDYREGKGIKLTAHNARDFTKKEEFGTQVA